MSDHVELRVLRALGRHVSGFNQNPRVYSGEVSGKEYLNYEFNPNVPLYDGYCFDYMVSNLLQKWKGWESKVDTSAVALKKWFTSEDECAATNERLKLFRAGVFPSLRVLQAITLASEKIEKVLGRFERRQSKTSKSSYLRVLEGCRWSTGATLSTRRGATVQEKMTPVIAVTPLALKHLVKAVGFDPNWIECLTGEYPQGPVSLLLKECFSEVLHNRFLTVPKNAKTDRCIAAEPAGNAFLQQGVGRYIRHRLSRFGIDLSDQSVNYDLARFASKSEQLATLDLSAASDSLATELVWLLLPPAWAEYLDDLRSPFTQLPDGRRIKLAKFASMGNAYTFELETLIFWALAQAASVVVKGSIGTCSVYGDDIIVEKDVADFLVELLGFVGFKVNTSKSYNSGSFRESCGGHFNSGIDVTPIFQKEIVGRQPHELVRLHNRLWRWYSRSKDLITSGQAQAVDEVLVLLRQEWRKITRHRRWPMPAVPAGSSGGGDDGFITNGEIGEPQLGPFDPNHGYKCRVLVWKPLLRVDRSDHSGYLAYKLRVPENLNTDPKGYVARSHQGRWILADRYIQRW